MTTRDVIPLIRKAELMVRNDHGREEVRKVVEKIPEEQVTSENMAAGYVFMFKKVVDYLEGKDGRDVIIYDF